MGILMPDTMVVPKFRCATATGPLTPYERRVVSLAVYVVWRRHCKCKTGNAKRGTEIES